MDKQNKNAVSLHDGHRERLRERFLKFGIEGMEEHEILELLLFYVIPRKDTNEFAHNLINRHGSLIGVLEATPQQISEIKGLSQRTAAFLKLISDVVRLCKEQSKKWATLNSFEECGEFLLERYKGFTNEVVSIICLDRKCNILRWVPILEGGRDSVQFNTKKIISAVVESDADSVVLAHNHPFGTALPSDDDVTSTILIRETLMHINVVLLDHIIICDDDFVSMASSKSYQHIFIK